MGGTYLMDVNGQDGKGVLIVWLRACVRGRLAGI